MDNRPFTIFGPSHWIVLLLTVLSAVGLVKLLRSRHTNLKRIVRWGLAVSLVSAVLADPPITYFRYVNQDPALAWRLVQETAWPFYLCDVAAICAALALVLQNQTLAEITWCWGLGGTMQGLIYPSSLSYDWPNPDFYAFFAEHAGVPLAAISLVIGMQLRPEPGVVWRVWKWLWVYYAGAAVVNLLLKSLGGYTTANYGFVCSSDYSPFAILGPWPVYVFMQIDLLAGVFTMLTFPFLRHKGGYSFDNNVKNFRTPLE